MAKSKSARQGRFLFSKGSPLTKKQKGKLASEIGSGKVRIKGGKKLLGKKPSKKRGQKR
jgi:hypothetical protein